MLSLNSFCFLCWFSLAFVGAHITCHACLLLFVISSSSSTPASHLKAHVHIRSVLKAVTFKCAHLGENANGQYWKPPESARTRSVFTSDLQIALWVWSVWPDLHRIMWYVVKTGPGLTRRTGFNLGPNLKRLNAIRLGSSVAATGAVRDTARPKPPWERPSRRGRGDACPAAGVSVDFEHTREAYKSKDSLELLRSLVVFKLCSYDILVDKNKEVIHYYGLLLCCRCGLRCSLSATSRMKGTFKHVGYVSVWHHLTHLIWTSLTQFKSFITKVVKYRPMVFKLTPFESHILKGYWIH